MSDINRWELSGNLGADPQSSRIGKAYIVTFSICHKDYQTGDKFWMQVKCVNSVGRKAKPLRKGDYVAVSGAVKHNKGLYIEADMVEMLKERR